MSDDLETQLPKNRRLSPSLVGGIMGIVAVISPIVISFSDYGWEDSITNFYAMMWQMSYSSWGQEFYSTPSIFLGSLPLNFMRIVFVVMMIRLYQGKTTKKRTLVVGIVSEFLLVSLFYGSMLLTMLLSSYPISYLQITIPIPILLVIGLLIMKLSILFSRSSLIRLVITASTLIR